MLHPIGKFFHNHVPSDFGHVLLGEDQQCKIVGMGKVRIKLNNGNEWLLKDVRHISIMKRNLISIGQLGDREFCLHLEKHGGRSLKEHW